MLINSFPPSPQGAGVDNIPRDTGEEKTSNIKKVMSDHSGSRKWVSFAPGVCPTTVWYIVNDHGTALKTSLQPSSSSPSAGFVGQAFCEDKCPFVPVPSIFRNMTNLLLER